MGLAEGLVITFIIMFFDFAQFDCQSRVSPTESMSYEGRRGFRGLAASFKFQVSSFKAKSNLGFTRIEPWAEEQAGAEGGVEAASRKSPPRQRRDGAQSLEILLDACGLATRRILSRRETAACERGNSPTYPKIRDMWATSRSDHRTEMNVFGRSTCRCLE